MASIGAALAAILAAAAADPQGKEPSEADEQEVHRYVQAAAALFRSLDNERALDQLAQARALPHRLEDSVQISLYEGLILSDLGKRAESEAAFRAAFALNPEAKLPLPVSPKLEAWIQKLRADTRRQLDRVPKEPAPLVPKADVPAPEPAPAATTEVAAGSGHSGGLSPWIPMTAAGVFLAGAGVCALLEHGIENRLNSGDLSIGSPAQLDSVMNLGRAYATAGVVLAGAGIASLILSAIVYWKNDYWQQDSLSVAPTGHGAAVIFSGRLP